MLQTPLADQAAPLDHVVNRLLHLHPISLMDMVADVLIWDLVGERLLLVGVGVVACFKGG